MKGFMALLAVLPLAVHANTNECIRPTDAQISALFDQWNQSLQSQDSNRMLDHYAEGSILLPTVSNSLRISPEEKRDYFKHFMANAPRGNIVTRHIQTDCNTALDSGIYEFSFASTGDKVRARYSFSYRWVTDRWLISSHHSSVMPQG
ncbi:MAG: SgcJ/EcaC family oxidoreductase [Pseudomonas sp.]|uniref:SgcJ/EcaC family oxidoreductase n=1 Tax=Pseudomonas abieticivorans TaxID=2931382 RepID=UPI0020BF6451|nr:SgcJ/EcaC family oxidoreductase [Pseudomonas sp. PIA16]MDE1166576.1 SgcJ/EcaC family oxidoreductase [Pseudomonas sp.]